MAVPNRALPFLLVASALALPALADLGSSIPATPPPVPAQAVAGEPGVRDLTPVQRPVATLAAPAADLAVTAWVDHEDNVYRTGDDLTLYVKTSKDAHVTVLDVGSSGQMHVVFPNQHQPDGFVKAGKVMVLPGRDAPFRFKVSPPVGTNVLKIIATSSPIALFKPGQLSDAGPFKSVAGTPEQLAGDLKSVLSDKKGQWAQYTKIFRIAEPKPQESKPMPVAAATPASGLLQVAPPAGSFALRLTTDRPRYRLGENVRVTVGSDRDCHLTLLDAGTSGKVTVVFPNRFQPQTLLRAGQTVSVPAAGAAFDFRAAGPAGTEALVAICRPTPEPLLGSAYDFTRTPFMSLGDSSLVVKDLATVMAGSTSGVGHAAVSFQILP
ncbi:DUF4384 domain-containing protein [Niveispirillum sp.]|uniref:DUF4384 domain-containing protein n=1 Tax=Niveispirillum sp. TaxID=1917217 RepID=UPI001B7A7737|nr:DUF4384 domain-containing protein [Niveispirillum sp.]MBP7335871.1 DUF4384 domain-containing protein [Niveispirillum sp.]